MFSFLFDPNLGGLQHFPRILRNSIRLLDNSFWRIEPFTVASALMRHPHRGLKAVNSTGYQSIKNNFPLFSQVYVQLGCTTAAVQYHEQGYKCINPTISCFSC
jgi:hypothetical protein